MIAPQQKPPSLENLIETLDLGEEVLHPGGLKTTRELAELCHIGNASRVLDVASGTGETACFLAETYYGQVVGIDFSEAMVQRRGKKPSEKGSGSSLCKATLTSFRSRPAVSTRRFPNVRFAFYARK